MEEEAADLAVAHEAEASEEAPEAVDSVAVIDPVATEDLAVVIDRADSMAHIITTDRIIISIFHSLDTDVHTTDTAEDVSAALWA